MKKVKFNCSIYSDKTIRTAILAYQHHAAISVKFKDGYSILTFWKCKYNEELTIKEFENYLIGIENS